MKNLLLLTFTILLSAVSFAQSGINYKAIIKDGSGTIVANQNITVQFSILQGVAQTNVYQETHTPTTNANGLIIVYIGAGTVGSGDFSTIDWGSDDHFLNVQMNTGAGLTDMGTTQFMAVPYALSAANVTGLEAIDEGIGVGWRLKGMDPANYNKIAENAVDLSISTSASTIFGASGTSSIAMGYEATAAGNFSTAIGISTVASGHYATAIGNYADASGYSSMALGSSTEASGTYSRAMGYYTRSSGNTATTMGYNTEASGTYSTAMGNVTEASGDRSTAMGSNAKAEAYNSTVFGRYNISGGNGTTWVEVDPLFEIGNGTSNVNRSNALTVLKNGTITAPSFDVAEITDDKALITKEYLEANSSIGLEAIDEGNGIGYRLKGSDPAFYNDIGQHAVDLSIALSSSDRGASGIGAIAMGHRTEASGIYSTAMGSSSIASGQNSIAIGYGADGLGPYATAIGVQVEATGNSAIAMGSNNATASGDLSIAMGANSTASGKSSTTMGAHTTASGNTSTAIGSRTTATAIYSTAMGRCNLSGGGDPTTWIETDPLLEVGNGIDVNNKSNAFTILKNGTITAPSFDLAEITDAKALITKEYLEANGSSGLEAIDEGNGIGWRLKGNVPANYNNIGLNAVDLSTSLYASEVLGASGNNATAMGSNTIASGDTSTAIGNETIASLDYATAMGNITTASGYVSTAMGDNTVASAAYTTAIGRYNVGGGNATSWIATDPLFEIGNGSIGSQANALTVLKNGQVGIGKHTNIGGKLEIQTNSTFTHPQLALIEDNASYARLKFKNTNRNGDDYWDIAGFIGTAVADDRLNFYNSINGDLMIIKGDGNVTIQGSLTQNSDRRLKRDVETIDFGIAEILQLNPVQYNWKDKENKPYKSLGVIAQEIEEVIPNVVQIGDDSDQTLSVSYTELIPVLIKAIQEQQAIINSQETKIATQEKYNEVINQRLAKLEGSANSKNLNNKFTVSAQKK